MKAKKVLKISLDLSFMFAIMLLAFLMLVPLLWMLTTSFKVDSQIWLSKPVWIPNPMIVDHYIAAWKKVPVIKFFFNSLLTSSLVTLGVVITSSLAGYAFARIKFKGRDKILLFFMSTMMIPIYVIAIPLFMIINSMDLINTYTALILPSIVSAFGIFMMRQFFLSIPKEYDESAFIDGCSRLKILTKIILPQSKPAISALIIFIFMGAWNNFFWPLLVTTKLDFYTLQLGLTYFQQHEYMTDWGALMAISCIATIPVLVVYLIAQKYFVEGMTMAGIKG